MKAVSLILNTLILPGAGSLLIGKRRQGISQILIFLAGLGLCVLTLSLLGAPLCIGAWIWAILTSLGAPQVPGQANPN